MVQDNGATVWDTAPSWASQEQVDEGEDLYSAN